MTPACSEKVENEQIMAVISFTEGMGLGRVSDKAPITEMKTFIGKDTLNKGQRDLMQMLDEDEVYQEGISYIGNSTNKAPVYANA